MEPPGDTPADRIRSRQTRLDAKKAGGAASKRDARSDPLHPSFSAASRVPAKALARVSDGMAVLESKKVSA